MTATNKRTLNILLVEDNQHYVLLTREIMKSSVARVRLHVAEDGEQALSFLRREVPFEDAPRPDLILLDLNLPNINGREVLAMIKTDPDLLTIPVLVLTTSDAEEDVSVAYRLHANCFLTKPLNLDEFGRLMRLVEELWLREAKLPPEA